MYSKSQNVQYLTWVQVTSAPEATRHPIYGRAGTVPKTLWPPSLLPRVVLSLVIDKRSIPKPLVDREISPGLHMPESGYVGGPSAAKQELRIGRSTASGSGSTSQYNAGQVSLTGQHGSGKPKGTDLTQGGFDGDKPNASYNADIGSKSDPGMAAGLMLQVVRGKRELTTNTGISLCRKTRERNDVFIKT
ncbi:hypothetical protein EYZ11_000028 [Aspergillus tanneri]|uniref:Uncharacterized protein n=1 Tax=Aspergillus tanneri TaxID=1220188 RepID=A0A4S3JYG2_9EURO|nr:hypothetical protein EYZ11_000028 [Aspergillus tanneri]